MNKLEKYKIGDFLTQTKNFENITNKLYSLITITNKGIIKLREKKNGSLIKAKKGILIKQGEFIYSRLSVHTGAYGIVTNGLDGALVTNEMPTFSINEKIIIPELFVLMLSLPYLREQIRRLTSGMGRVRVKEKDFLDLFLYIPPYEQQEYILNKINSIDSKIDISLSELNYQQSLLKQLRHAILQEAVEGKLTDEWRKANPELISGKNHAARLLKKIKAKKEQLIKEGKIKKQKPPPSITNNEKPFDLPEGWVWCRLGEIGNAENYPFVDGPFGSSINTKSDYINSGIPVLRMLNVKPFKFIDQNLKYIREKKFKKLIRHNVIKNDVLFSKVGAGIGEACKIPDSFGIGMLSTTGITRLRVGEIVLPDYLCIFLNVNNTNFKKLSTNTAQPFLNMTMIKNFLFSLPPIAEQQAIVEKVDRLMVKIDALKLQVKERKTQAEQLMQTVLREAFERN